MLYFVIFPFLRLIDYFVPKFENHIEVGMKKFHDKPWKVSSRLYCLILASIPTAQESLVDNSSMWKFQFRKESIRIPKYFTWDDASIFLPSILMVMFHMLSLSSGFFLYNRFIMMSKN